MAPLLFNIRSFSCGKTKWWYGSADEAVQKFCPVCGTDDMTHVVVANEGMRVMIPRPPAGV